jgi:hypothetical protein
MPAPTIVPHPPLLLPRVEAALLARPRPTTRCHASGAPRPRALDATVARRGGIREYVEAAREMAHCKDGGPARWFTPLDCGGAGGRVPRAPTLLYLPGMGDFLLRFASPDHPSSKHKHQTSLKKNLLLDRNIMRKLLILK